MSKGSRQRVRWSSTFAEQYDKIFGKKHVFDAKDVISPKEVELDLSYKDGNSTKRTKK